MIKRLIDNKVLMLSAFWAWYIFLFVMSVMKSPDAVKLELEPNNLFRADYLIHFSVFFVLGFPFFSAYKSSLTKLPIQIIRFLLLGLILAFISEYSQKINPDRTFNPMDLAYNIAGVLISGCCFPFLVRKI